MQNKIIGIYLITEKATGKMYVGLSGGRDGIEGRWFKHRKRFPEALFSYEIFHPCPSGTTRAELSLLEKFYIRELDCMEPNGFNRTSGGTGSTEVSEATKKRQSEAGKNRAPASAEARANMSAFQKGRVKGPMSEEQKLKLSQAAKERAVLKRAARAEALAVLEASLLQDPQTISTPE